LNFHLEIDQKNTHTGRKKRENPGENPLDDPLQKQFLMLLSEKKEKKAFSIEEKKHPVPPQGRPLLLGTLIRLRWFALAGQTIAVLFVAYVLNYPLPLLEALALIGVSALLNFALSVKFGLSHRPTTALAATQLAFDNLQIAGLLWLTGGLQNPFSLLLLAPVSVSATILPRRETAMVGALALTIVSLLAFSHRDLPWDPKVSFDLPTFYVTGVWVALVCGIVFVTIYANRVAHESRQLSDALSATELALSHQQHLSALDGLAAAAAHELGTPLATITVAAKEMQSDIAEGALAEDLQLIIEQAARCRSILSRLRSLDSEETNPFMAVPVSELFGELVRPFSHLDKNVKIELEGDPEKQPMIVRHAGLLHGLGNLIENAVQFSRKNVVITARWDDHNLNVTITDDGPGYPADLLPRLGEPYLKTTAPGRTDARSSEIAGLGLGVFIAKTLLVRSGATIRFSNKYPSVVTNTNAQVHLRWPRFVLQV